MARTATKSKPKAPARKASPARRKPAARRPKASLTEAVKKSALLPFTYSPDAIRRTWPTEQSFKTKGMHRKIDPIEEMGLLIMFGMPFIKKLGLSDPTDFYANDAGVLFVNVNASSLSCSEGPVSSFSLLATSQDEYSIRFHGHAEANPQLVPDELYIGGLRMIKTVPNVKRADLRQTLERELNVDLHTPPSKADKLKRFLISAREVPKSCPCQHCDGARAEADRTGKDLTQLKFADDPEVIGKFNEAFDEISKTEDGRDWLKTEGLKRLTEGRTQSIGFLPPGIHNRTTVDL